MSKPWKGGCKRTFAESNSEQSASASLAATLAHATQKQSGKRWKPAEAVGPDDVAATQKQSGKRWKPAEAVEPDDVAATQKQSGKRWKPAEAVAPK